MSNMKAHHADSASAWQIMGSIVFVVGFVALGFYYMGKNMMNDLDRRGIVSKDNPCAAVNNERVGDCKK